MRRRRFAAAFARAAFAACIVVAAGPASPRDGPAPNAPVLVVEALRVATYAERLLKLQAQAGQGILGERARRANAEALRHFDASVRALGVPAAPAELHENAAILSLLAREYRAWALKAPTRDNARRLGERAEELAWMAAKVARLLGEETTGAAALAAKAARASTGAQRVGRLVLWQHWGVGGDSVANELALAQAALEADVQVMHAAAGNTPAIEAELQVADNQLAFLVAAARRLQSGGDAARDLEFVAKTSDNVHESMERVAALYLASAR